MDVPLNNGLNWQCCLVGSSKTADCSFEVKNIEIWVPAFFKHNNSSVATVPHESILDYLEDHKTLEKKTLRWLSSVRFNYKPGYRSCDLLKSRVLSLVENLFFKNNPLQDLLSSLNAVISTNERP